MKIEEVDKNFAGVAAQAGSTTFFDVKKDSRFVVCGLMEFPVTGKFERISEGVAANLQTGVRNVLRYHTAGGRVRFRTDSPYVDIAYTGPDESMSHATLIMTNGFDVYSGKKYLSSVLPPLSFGERYLVRAPLFHDGKLHTYTLDLPLYGRVEELLLGIREGSRLLAPSPYRMEKPVLFYGSSITQGGCASRPGTCYEAYISHELDCDYYNFGFSGNAMGEISFAKYLASIDAAALVLDYDHNAPTIEHLAATHEPFYKAYRALRPDTPVVMASKPDFYREPVGYRERRRQVVKDTCEHALAAGEKVAFVDGSTFYPHHCREQCTVDGCHPNDLGFYFMAKKILFALRSLL